MSISLSNVLPNSEHDNKHFFVFPVDPATLERMPGSEPVLTLGKYLKFYDSYNKANESTESAWTSMSELLEAAFSNASGENPVTLAKLKALQAQNDMLRKSLYQFVSEAERLLASTTSTLVAIR